MDVVTKIYIFLRPHFTLGNLQNLLKCFAAYLSFCVVVYVLSWIFLPSLSISLPFFTFTPFLTLRPITYRSRPTTGSDGVKRPGLTVRVGEVGIRPRWAGGVGAKGADGCTKQSGWFVFYARGVKVDVSKEWWIASKPSQTPSTPSQPRAATSSRRILPILLHVGRLLLRFLLWWPVWSLWSFVAYEVEGEVTVEGVACLSATASVGSGTYPASSSSAVPRRGIWIALGGVNLKESSPFTPSPSSSSTPQDHLPAVSLSERLAVLATVPLGVLIPQRASVDINIAFGKGQRDEKTAAGLHVRMPELRRIMRDWQKLSWEKKQRGKQQAAARGNPQVERVEQPTEMTEEPAALRRMNRGASLLGSISFVLPELVVSAHYHTPEHIIAAAAASASDSGITPTALPKSVGFAATVKDVDLRLWMAGTSDDAHVKEGHKAWLGKGRELALAVQAGFGGIEGRVNVDGSGEDILPASNKAFGLAQTSLSITSTWLPPDLAPHFDLPQHATKSTRNYNDDTVVVEGHLGEMGGHLEFQTLDAALRIFKARPRPPAAPCEATAPESSDPEEVPPTNKQESPTLLRGLPRIAGCFYWDKSEFRVQAPLVPERETPSGDDWAEHRFNRTWMSPDVLVVDLPSGAMEFGAEYRERSLIRSDAQRRAASRWKRRSGGGERHDDEDEGAEATTSATTELEKALGVPPPPPIHRGSQRFPSAPRIPNNDLIDQPMLYMSRFHLSADTLNVFILASNDGSNDEDGASWLNEPTLPSESIRFDILAISSFELSAPCKMFAWEVPNCDGTSSPVVSLSSASGGLNILVDTVGVDLWRPAVMSSLRDFLKSFADASHTATLKTVNRPSPPPTSHRPLIKLLPLDISVYLAVTTLDMRVAGSDPKDQSLACRGIAAHSDAFVIEYLLQGSHHAGSLSYPQRTSLELREDIGVEANAHLSQHPGKLQAFFKFTAQGVHVDPVFDARRSKGHTKRASTKGGHKEEEPVDWELKNRGNLNDNAHRRRSILPTRKKELNKISIVSIPHLTVRCRVQEHERVVRDDAEGHDVAPLDDAFVSVESEALTLRVDLNSVYLCLMAVSAIKSLSPPKRLPCSATAIPRPLPSPANKRPSPRVTLKVDFQDFHTFLTLPQNVKLYCNLRHLRVQKSLALGVVVEWDMLLLTGQSPAEPSKWEDIIRFRITTIKICREPGNTGYRDFTVSLAAESARLRVPFRYVFSSIVDNVVNLVKALKQLVHEHVKGGQDWILEPEEEEAKRLPKISLNIKMFVLEFGDDPFETKLNKIWRAGYEEQAARLERDRAFEEKADAVREYDANGGVEEEVVEADHGEHSHAHHAPKVNGRHRISIKEARQGLHLFNSEQWTTRIRNATSEQRRREERLNNRLYGVKATTSARVHRLPVDVNPTSELCPLFRATFQELRFTISRPTFSDEPGGLANYLADVGKGMPDDTKFTLLVPIHFSWKMDEVRCQIRDYPLPLLHVPPMAPGAVGGETASWVCESDLVIAEEISGPDAVRRVDCIVVPPRAANEASPYILTVPRSAMPVKTYAVPTIRIRSPYATRIGWGNSIQPAIQDIARAVDSLSKPSPDPSDRIGFWDKLRLQFHWRIQFLWEGEGPLNIHLKGMRDPYALNGFGAGFVKSWRGNVKLMLGHKNEDREFFQIVSNEYVLAIPNLESYVDAAATGTARDPHEHDDKSHQYPNGAEARRSLSEEADMLKVVARFSGGVRWGMGIVLEHVCPPDCPKPECTGRNALHRQCRFFDFVPHWQVHTRAAHTVGPRPEVDDSFAGFRSDFIHFSISLTSPLTGWSEDSPTNSPKSHSDDGFNSLYLAPQTSSHFWAWWRLFDGTMSLPIRQGKYFPSATPPSKKFGRHCATIKYRFSLAPLFIVHTYRLEQLDDWTHGVTNMVGLKGRIGRFDADLHQRSQEDVIRLPNSKETKTVVHKSFAHAQVNCDGVDLRVISARFSEPEKQEFVDEGLESNNTDDVFSDEDSPLRDEDMPWVDLLDFVDAVYKIPDPNPKIEVKPLLLCPNFVYVRDTDATNSSPSPEPSESGHVPHHSADSDNYDRVDEPELDEDVPLDRERVGNKFGHEPSHTCLLGNRKTPLKTQAEGARARLAELEAQARSFQVRENEVQMLAIRRRIESIKKIIEQFDGIEEVRTRSGGRMPGKSMHEDDGQPEWRFPHLNDALYSSEESDWTNRYQINSPSIQVSNKTRDLLLRYFFASRERKGFSYHMSATAIKFIRDLAKEHDRRNKHQSRRKSMRTGGTLNPTPTLEKAQQTTRLLDELIESPNSRAANESESGTPASRVSFGEALDVDHLSFEDDLPNEFEARHGHLVQFLMPQISLQSDKDDKSTVIITAFATTLRVYQIVDVRILEDPINHQVLNKTYGTLQDMQMFYPSAQPGQTSRASFVPLETLLDVKMETVGFDRLLPRTSAAIRYDKFNQLRMSSKLGHDDNITNRGPGGAHFRTGTDRVSLECPSFQINADPWHFGAIYNVVTDLLLYTDPLQKSRVERLEKMAFTTDWANLPRAAETALEIQRQIRGLVGTMQLYQTHLDQLDEDGRRSLFWCRSQLAKFSLELNLVVQSISRAQSQAGTTTDAKAKTPGIHFEARASELVWHMLDKSGQNFVKFSVKGVEFSWISKQDSSVSNRLVIKDLRALNSAPDQVFAEIISKHDHAHETHELARVDVFAAILWNSLAPVGGISIVEQFEVHLHPLRLQLEHCVGRAILDYVFAQRREAGDDESPTPTKRPGPTSSQNLATPSSSSLFSRSTDSLVVSPSKSNQNTGRPASYAESIPSNRSSGALLAPSPIHGLRRAASAEILVPQVQEEGLDPDEMRSRASLNRTFVLVDLSATMVYLTYHSEKEDRSPIPDIYNIQVRVPAFKYRNRTWSYLDILDKIKKDMIKAMFTQKGALFSQVLNKAHRNLPLPEVRSGVKKSITSTLKSKLLHRRHAPPPSNEPRAAPLSSLRTVVATGSAETESSISMSRSGSDSSEQGVAKDDSASPHVFGAPFVMEPDNISTAPTDELPENTSKANESSISSTTSSSQPSPERQGTPILGDNFVGKAPKLRHLSSSAANDLTLSYPIHEPLNATTSSESDCSKARILLGKSMSDP